MRDEVCGGRRPQHSLTPIRAPRVPVGDEKMSTVTYECSLGTLAIECELADTLSQGLNFARAWCTAGNYTLVERQPAYDAGQWTYTGVNQFGDVRRAIVSL